MRNYNTLWKIFRIIIFLAFSISAIIVYVSDHEVWTLGQYLFNNTFLITGIVGLFFETYKK